MKEPKKISRVTKKKPAKIPKKPAVDKEQKVVEKEVAEEDTSLKSLFESGLQAFPRSELKVYPTGSLAFDKILAGDQVVEGVRGLPSGRFIEICSPSGYGKSTIALSFCKSLIQQGVSCVYLDAEHAVNDILLSCMGLREYVGTKLAVHPVQTFADVVRCIDHYLQAEDVKLFVLDSITATLPDKLQGEIEITFEPGLHARFVSQFYPRIKGAFAKMGKILLVINQTRQKISFKGSMSGEQVPAGGAAQEFYMDIRIVMQDFGTIWSDRKPSNKQSDHDLEAFKEGMDLGIWTVKNKFCTPYIKSVASVFWGKGVSNVRCLDLFAQEMGWAKHVNMGYYSINVPGAPEAKVRGLKAVEEWVRDNYEAVLAAVRTEGYL